MPYLNIQDSRLYYEVHGDSGPTIVFFHGASGNHAVWYNQIHHLSSRFRLVVLDARGFGNSSDAEVVGRSGFVDDLLAVLDGLEIERAILVGESAGGGPSLAVACRQPERVAALVLVSTLVGFSLPAEPRQLVAEGFRSMEGLPQVARVLGNTIRRERPAAATLFGQLESFNHVKPRTLTGEVETHSPAELAATGVPTLFIVGGEDRLFPPSAVRIVHEMVAGSTFVEIGAAGHSVHFEEPEAFNEALLAWLRSIGVEEA